MSERRGPWRPRGVRLLAALGLALASLPLHAADSIQGRWVGAVVRDGKSFPLSLDVRFVPPRHHACLDLPELGILERCTTEVAYDRDGWSLRFTSGKDSITLDGAVDGGHYHAHWVGLGVEAEAELIREAAASAPLATTDFMVRNGAVQLAATLVHAPGERAVPAVVWTHGSGRQTRTTDFYRDRAWLFARQGIASVIYDKRGSGASSGDADATLEDLASDAAAVVAAARALPGVRGDRVGVGGFSQGGYVAPMVAARDPAIAFVIVGSAPGISPAAQNEFTARRALESRGFDPDTVARALALRARAEAVQRGTGEAAEVETALRAAQAEPWFRPAGLPVPPLQRFGAGALSVLDHDPLAVWRAVRAPVFAVWGSADRFVPAGLSRKLIDECLRGGRMGGKRLLVVEGADHGLLVAQPAGGWDWPRLAPEFQTAMLDWARARAR